MMVNGYMISRFFTKLLRKWGYFYEIWDENTELEKINYSKDYWKSKERCKKALIPGYGKKGSGWIKNPKKAAYNKVYKKTSFGIMDLFK